MTMIAPPLLAVTTMWKFLSLMLLVSSTGKLIQQVQGQTPAYDVWVTVGHGWVHDTDVKRKIGLNLNAGIDNDTNRPVGARPLSEAVQDMGAKVLRFPGGEKTNYYYWAEPPFVDPSTNYWMNNYYGQNAMDTMNFDEFMVLCQETNCTPHINVAVNEWDNSFDGVGAAAAWVRYANVDNDYGVTYWEIGNEMWNGKGYTTQTLADLVAEYSDAMKAVDPTIKICSSCFWYEAQEFIDLLGDKLDFISISNYKGRISESIADGYEDTPDVDLTNNDGTLMNNDRTLPKKTIVSEWNENLWFDEAELDLNSAGKGILNFDAICQFLKDPMVEYSCFWNTRWYNMNGDVFDALDDQNELLPNVRPFNMLSRFLHDTMIGANEISGDIVSYASYDSTTKDMSVFLINKHTDHDRTITIELSIDSDDRENLDYDGTTAELHRYAGNDYRDEFPTYGPAGTIAVEANMITGLVLPPVSITAIVLTTAVPLKAILYDGNGSSSGTVPVDPNMYEVGEAAVILGNPGNLGRDGYSFTSWNTASDGSGTSYVMGGVMVVTDNIFSLDEITLYAQWIMNEVPSATPSATPSGAPTTAPSAEPTAAPSATPSGAPTTAPSAELTSIPPTGPATSPSIAPTSSPTTGPTTSPSGEPSSAPTGSAPSQGPSLLMTMGPTSSPTGNPTGAPTTEPTTSPSGGPTVSPTAGPTSSPTGNPTGGPTSAPTIAPTGGPTTVAPTVALVGWPSEGPTSSPSDDPTSSPSSGPTSSPSAGPTTSPSSGPTASPSTGPTTSEPTLQPSASPSSRPSSSPTTSQPSSGPTTSPSSGPTNSPPTEACADDPSWFYGNSNKPRFCSSVANNPNNWCRKIGTGGLSGYEACPVTCSTCP